ncbi:hypothetical protein [Microvirga soli]|uniref:hypothetical protein n=1 Tax=Microvirga soli TaxID=1854496 RepID=UPI00191CA9FB|nr:hypothetical protein [Microvirga soli]
MMNFKIICFAITGALLGSVVGVVSSFLFMLIFGQLVGRLLGIGSEFAWYGFLIGPLFAIIGFLIGGYYGAWVAVWTKGYSLREYARRIWDFLSNE